MNGPPDSRTTCLDPLSPSETVTCQRKITAEQFRKTNEVRTTSVQNIKRYSVKFSMMKSAIGWLAFGLVVLSVRLTEAQLNCYECVHTETDHPIEGYETTCAQPFIPDGVDTCMGTACLITWHDFGSMGYGINRTCYTDPPPGSIENCLVLNQYQKLYTFFVYEALCCYSTDNGIDINGMLLNFTSTICICDKDYCNNDILNYITSPSPTQPQPTGGATLAPGATQGGNSSGSLMILSQSVVAATLLVTKFGT